MVVTISIPVCHVYVAPDAINYTVTRQLLVWWGGPWLIMMNVMVLGWGRGGASTVVLGGVTLGGWLRPIHLTTDGSDVHSL